MTDLRVISDRVEIEALRGEFIDAVMMRDYDRFASLFTDDGVLRMPHAGSEVVGRAAIRAGAERAQAVWACFVQTTHPGTIALDGNEASGRAYIFELMHGPVHGSLVNHGLWHDRYRRTRDGWKFTERTYEIRYIDTTPLAGAASPAGDQSASSQPG